MKTLSFIFDEIRKNKDVMGKGKKEAGTGSVEGMKRE